MNIIAKRTFIIKEVNLNELLQSDSDFRLYFESGEDRYEYEDVNPSDIDNELVIVDGELFDGYNRASVMIRSGQNTAYSYVAKKYKNTKNENNKKYN